MADEPGPDAASLGGGALVTFLFTDVVGSTAAWEAHPAEMARALERHDEIIERSVRNHGGEVVRPRGEGDSRFAVFRDPGAALKAATHLHAQLAAEPWPPATPITVRCALHTGPVEHRNGDYYGSAVNRCARLRSIANPGQVLASEATVSLAGQVVGSAVDATDLGVHWLKDLTHPERVFQVERTGSRRTFPALPSRPPRHLSAAPVPVPVTSFVGRGPQVDRLLDILRGRSANVVTITGPGGVGKTRLAIEVASHLGPELVGGTSFVDLSSVSDPAGVASAITTALGIADQGGRDPLSALVERFEVAEALLVLDNMEHVVAAAPVVSELARRSPGLRVLVTSRAPLRISGESEHALPPLSLPPTSHDPNAAASSEAVALFVERAQAHRSTFELTSQNAPAIAAICVRLDGLPLALELAAARVKLLDPADLLGRLDQSLDFLVAGERDLPGRQRTLRATVEWSFDLLDNPLRDVLDTLGVFEGSFTMPAIEAVCGTDSGHALALVSELVDNSLVQASEASGRLRFTLLQTIRELALEHLGHCGLVEERRARMADHVLATTEAAAGLLNGPAAPVTHTDLTADLPNIRAAFDHMLLGRPDDAARLTLALRGFWITQGRLSEGRRRIGDALAATTSDELRTKLLVDAGVLACYQDAYDEALTLLQEGLVGAERLSDGAAIATAACFLGTARLATGDREAARALAEQAQEASLRAQSYEASVQSLSLLAMLAGISGDVDTERALHRARLDRTRAQGDHSRTADTLNVLAEIALDEGEVLLARELADESLDLARGTSRLIVRDANLTLGRIALADRDVDRAARSFADGLRLSIDFAQPHELALALRGAAATAGLAGEPILAARLAGVARNVRDPDGVVFPVEQDLEEILAAARRAGPEPVYDAAAAAAALLTVGSGVEAAVQVLERLAEAGAPNPTSTAR